MATAVIYYKQKGVSIDWRSIRKRELKVKLDRCDELLQQNKELQAKALFLRLMQMKWNWEKAQKNPFEICRNPRHLKVNLTKRNCDVEVFKSDDGRLMYTVEAVFKLPVKASVDNDQLQEWINESWAFDCVEIHGGWERLDYMDGQIIVKKIEGTKTRAA